MMAKRSATSDLNRDNWHEEEEPEEFGIFKQASEKDMKGRLIKKAKRRGETNLGQLKPVFNHFTAFKTEPISSPKFSFGLKANTPQVVSFAPPHKKEGTNIVAEDKSKMNVESNVNKVVSSNHVNAGIDKSKFQFSFTSGQNILDSKATESTAEMTQATCKAAPESPTNNSVYFGKLKSLNVDVLKWIQQHVDKNPYISLIPVFDDYKKFLLELKETNKGNSCNSPEESCKLNTNRSPKCSVTSPSNLEKAKPSFSFGTTDSVVSGSTFSFGTTTQPSLSFNFSGANNPQSAAAVPNTGRAEAAGEPSDEPPIVTVDEVKEEGSVYDKKVKLFYKKDGNYVEKGVGTLFLKPAGEKTQLIVRALTNLGNILLNIVLNSSIPSQRLGKNNVLIMCIPNPPLEAKAPNTTPISMLIRVKTSQEADELLAKIEEHKK